MYILKPETPDLAPAVETMLDNVFGPGRQDKASYLYRAGVQPVAELSWTALAGDRLVGTIRYWPILVGEAGLQALLLGPLGIDQEFAGRGIGRAEIADHLRRHALADAERIADLQRVVLVAGVRERHAVRGDRIERVVADNPRDRVTEGLADRRVQRRHLARVDVRRRKRSHDARAQDLVERDGREPLASHRDAGIAVFDRADGDVDPVE